MTSTQPSTLRNAVLAIGASFALLLGEVSSSAGGAERHAGQACNTIKFGGVARIFYKNNMSCDRAKRYARHVRRSRGRWEPRRFSCDSGSNFRSGGFCDHDFKNKYFGWHPAD